MPDGGQPDNLWRLMSMEGAITKQDRELIASCGHLFVLFGIVAAVTLAGYLAQHRPTSSADLVETHAYVIPTYLSITFMNWLLVFFVWRGIHRHGISIRSLVQGRWANARDILTDLGIAAFFWGILLLAEWGLGNILGPGQQKSLSTLFPRTAVEVIFWILTSASAGFCEEFVFRGYLQRQFLALSGSVPIAVLGQGIVFALMHAYQGWVPVVYIVVIGVLFGALAAWRKTLRSGMVAHAWQDIWGGWLLYVIK
jgi:membrane protease YdiL (CAAX protease family)